MPTTRSVQSHAAPRRQRSFPTRRSSDLETDLVLPPHASVDTSSPIRCFGQPRNASTFVELTGTSWSFNGSSGCVTRSEEHTSELQSRPHLVCRLLLEKKKSARHLRSRCR